MKFSLESFQSILASPFYRLLGGAAALMTLYLMLVERAGDTAHLGMSVLFILAAGIVVNGIRVALMAVLTDSQQQASFQYWHQGDGSLIFGVAAIGVFGLIFSLLTHPQAEE